jgi:hypothetical protein
VHMWMKSTKSWSGTAEAPYNPMQNNRGRGISVMGALDMNSLDSYYQTIVKTKTEYCIDFFTNFFKFLKDKKDKKFRSLTTVVLVLDNHP